MCVIFLNCHEYIFQSESGFLNTEETKQHLPDILTEILEELNACGACCIPIGQLVVCFHINMIKIIKSNEILGFFFCKSNLYYHLQSVIVLRSINPMRRFSPNLYHLKQTCNIHVYAVIVN